MTDEVGQHRVGIAVFASELHFDRVTSTVVAPGKFWSLSPVNVL